MIGLSENILPSCGSRIVENILPRRYDRIVREHFCGGTGCLKKTPHFSFSNPHPRSFRWAFLLRCSVGLSDGGPEAKKVETFSDQLSRHFRPF